MSALEVATVTPRLLRPTRAHAREWMDDGDDVQALKENLRDLRRVNRWLGGVSLTAKALAALPLPPGERRSVVDIASGGADIPVALARRNAVGRVVAVDLNPVIVGVAEAGVETTAIEFVRADARSLPFTDEAFDAATCSLALHHFEPDDAVAVLRELARVVRFGIVVNDLIRSWHGYAGALVLSRLATRNPVTRHDAPLSVRRAYTRSELDVLLAHAGLRRLAAFGLLGVRVAVAAERV